MFYFIIFALYGAWAICIFRLYETDKFICWANSVEDINQVLESRIAALESKKIGYLKIIKLSQLAIVLVCVLSIFA